ncbi:19205_t:CDS:2 [Funneliformis geosporum]|uniref:14665_t:CDS:1 n=1 Tax=Funneliformis geosporum TaxID=1117311 RepID=A0A9W4SIW1_9GLOM|nr:14665_t:CDS:2 [Funneliformis geosporum]CAI2172230.1 19205_t:CDS:2 [Funneliformis geosporum]
MHEYHHIDFFNIVISESSHIIKYPNMEITYMTANESNPNISQAQSKALKV